MASTGTIQPALQKRMRDAEQGELIPISVQVEPADGGEIISELQRIRAQIEVILGAYGGSMRKTLIRSRAFALEAGIWSILELSRLSSVQRIDLDDAHQMV